MDGFFVAKLKKFAPGERKATSTSAGVPDKDAPEANEVEGSADGMDVDFRFVRCHCFCLFPSSLSLGRSSVCVCVKGEAEYILLHVTLVQPLCMATDAPEPHRESSHVGVHVGRGCREGPRRIFSGFVAGLHGVPQMSDPARRDPE